MLRLLGIVSLYASDYFQTCLMLGQQSAKCNFKRSLEDQCCSRRIDKQAVANGNVAICRDRLADHCPLRHGGILFAALEGSRILADL
jgi:hypothetical protein